MDFINKLIKKAIFGVVFVFAMFIFGSNSISVKAAECTITLNDGNKYLVLNSLSTWNDSGVSATCDSVVDKNVSISINGETAIRTTNSALGASNSALTSPGFYKIEYFLTDNATTKITRYVRVLPNDLNGVTNIWPSETEKINTANDDTFNRVIETNGKYLMVGNFDADGYIVAFNYRGELLWSDKLSIDGASSVELNDIVEYNAGTNLYYVAGEYVKNDVSKGFIAYIQLNTNGKINSDFTEIYDVTSASRINRMIMHSNGNDDYIFASGYQVIADGTTKGNLSRFTINGGSLEAETNFSETENLSIEYNSIIINDAGNIVAVGSSSIADKDGAIGGLVTICSVESFTCNSKSPYLYLNDNKASTTATAFNDIIEYNQNYIVVGNSRIDKYGTSVNSGIEDSLIVLLDSEFNILDLELSGTVSYDSAISIKKTKGTGNFIVVGQKANSGYYNNIQISNNEITMTESFISGGMNVSIKDIFVKEHTNDEVQYIIVGETNSSVVEGVSLGNLGNNDSMFLVVDATKFDNFEKLNIVQGTNLCIDDSVSCSASNLKDEYKLIYGSVVVGFPNDLTISSEISGTTYQTYHGFENAQGVAFVLGRKIEIVEKPIAPDFNAGTTGIDKWYLYSRKQEFGDNVSGTIRETLWTEYYYPVNNYDTKDENTTYYVFNSTTKSFDEDTRGMEHTYNNYIKLGDAQTTPQQTSAAFQSMEKAKEYALLQEFTRIAFVMEKYDYDKTGVDPFQGEGGSLSQQYYYYIYYIDLKFNDNTECSTLNNALNGNCTKYKGYAFSSLSKIKTIANLIVDKYNYFVSESNNRYNSNVSTPNEGSDFAEEVLTIKYTQSLSVNLGNINKDLYLVGQYYASNSTNDGFDATATEIVIKPSDGLNTVSFSETGNFTGEGKYVLRYCYNYENENVHCGASGNFVIDRTAPVVNYKSIDSEGAFKNSNAQNDPIKIKADIDIVNIADIDPYAYTIVNGVKYYLSCNSEINSQSCIDNIEEFVTRSFGYTKEDPTKVHEIHVYDRAGNKVNAYFIIGTEKPTIEIHDNGGADQYTFYLTIDFYDKNVIDSLVVYYTKSVDCKEKCADASVISDKLRMYINALIYINNQILLEANKGMQNNTETEEGEITEPVVPTLYTIRDLTFTYSTEFDENNIPLNGLELPIVNYYEDTGVYEVLWDQTEILTISQGLYKFVLADYFMNIEEAYGGIGLDKAELNVYVNADDVISDDDVITNSYRPVEIKAEGQENVFKVTKAETYKYADLITGNVSNYFDSSMMFTQKYVYIKIKANDFGTVAINKATEVNEFGNFIVNSVEKLECLFIFYGEKASGNLKTCKNQIKYSEIKGTASSVYNNEGVYALGEENGYYYFAFTTEGTYHIDSEVSVSIEISGEEVTDTAVPVNASFTIDTQSPTIDFEVTCKTGEICKGIKNLKEYDNEDFVYDIEKAKVSIGNYDMKLYINSETVLGGKVNKLLTVSIGGEIYNASAYSKAKGWNEEYILFDQSGSYEVVFEDGSLNQTIYRFVIDKSVPKIDNIVDINNKVFTEYQQYVDAKISISEDSFVMDKNEETMLVIKYGIEGEAELNTITFQNINNKCVVKTGGSYMSSEPECRVIETEGNYGLILSFVLTINKDEPRVSGYQTLNLWVSDYFGNEAEKTQQFLFDNYDPYIYYDSSYTPVKEFGSSIDSDELEKMLSVKADATLGDFICANTTLLTGKVICRDTPTITGKSNGVVVETYEAARVAFNNYELIGNQYVEIKNGTYIDVTKNVYRKSYTFFKSRQDLIDAIGNKTIYTKGNYVQVVENEQIDPNKIYYYGENKESISIKDMYTNTSYANYTTCDDSNLQCKLYRLYIDVGYFTEENYENYYILDSNDYKAVTTQITDYDNYANYYYFVDYMSDNGVYLPAVTLANSCIKVGNATNCVAVEENRIKVIDDNIVYYNILENIVTSDATTVLAIMFNGNAVSALIDDRIWQIAKDSNGNEIRFGFSLASNLGRPIIFRAKDGAGNISTTQLEAAIQIKDDDAPVVSNVSSISYVVDEEIVSSRKTLTKDNYILTYRYYKLIDRNVSCDSGNEFFTYDGSNYNSVSCSDMLPYTQYYSRAKVYEKVADGLTPDIEKNGYYYLKNEKTLTNSNYLTGENLSIDFNEPIYKIKCTYYLYTITEEGDYEATKECSINNVEFDYRDNQTHFELIYDETGSYYVNYKIEAYDFSGNVKVVNSLFIDRESPTLSFGDASNSNVNIEAVYDDISTNNNSSYNQSYLEAGFKQEINVVDKVNSRIGSLTGSLIDNKISYQVKYYKFNYNKTYNNFIKKANGSFERVADGLTKDSSQTYYISIKETDQYILKGNTGICSNGYCYIEDYYSYYPSLIDEEIKYDENDKSYYIYWEELEPGEYIKNNFVGVYKIEYIATDYSGNVSNTLRKTVYVVDSKTPLLKIDSNVITNKYGYHKSVNIVFENEYEATLYKYTCNSSVALTCILPENIFPESSSDFIEEKINVTSISKSNYNTLGIYKLYFHDKGYYVSSTVACDGSLGCRDTNSETVMTLKYNYVEYTFVIDTTAPEFYVTANKEDGKLYYEVSMAQEDYLYCVRADRNTNSSSMSFNEDKLVPCSDLLTETARTPSTEVSADGKTITNIIKNSSNQIIYEEVYQKVETNSPKYFYNTYYQLIEGTFKQYEIGAKYDNDNVYIIKSIKLYFREDGNYMIRGQDKAGNKAGRYKINDYESDGNYLGYSGFIIDNNAPDYNKAQNTPTGINYWYSVPGKVITRDMASTINYLIENKSGNYYNLSVGNLNSDIFYAFATRTEAMTYLTTIYTRHIQSQTNVCDSGKGFSYDYYNPSEGTIVNECFSNEGGTTGKDKALSKVISLFDKFIFPTFSGAILFGDNSIAQKACDETLSSDCVENKNMYKYIYLKTTDGTTSITEVCEEDDTTTCVKVNVKIIKNNSNGNNMKFEIGGTNTIDTSMIKIYSKSLTGGTNEVTQTLSSDGYVLNVDTYYIFEEYDTTIEYINYPMGGVASSKVTHYNVTYYAVFIDNNSYLDIYYQDDKGISTDNIISSDGYATRNTNSNEYYLIIKKDNSSNFLNNYDIYELKDANGRIIEIYSYIRLMINDVYYNINDNYVVMEYWFEIDGKQYKISKDKIFYNSEEVGTMLNATTFKIDDTLYTISGNKIMQDSTEVSTITETYYFAIPVGQEMISNISFIDRAGNTTRVEISHSKQAPSINIGYSTDAQGLNATITIRDTYLTKINKNTLEILFSEDGSEGSYSTDLTGNIRRSLICEVGTENLLYGCLNTGSINGVNRYTVKVSDLEHLHGFFKINYMDDHGNSNSIKFIYNPTNMSAEYINTRLRYITANMSLENKRMIVLNDNNDAAVQLSWNNKYNYIILYKVVENQLVKVCDSINMGYSEDSLCGDGSNINNKVVVNLNNGQYLNSILYYEDEGLYQAEIVNRASVTINNSCILEDGQVNEECKEFITPTSLVSSWENNPEYCKEELEVIIETVSKIYNGDDYSRIEIDKTAPQHDLNDFVVSLPTGDVSFENGEEYVNADVKIKWKETLIKVVVACEYIDGGFCSSRETEFLTNTNEYLFSIENRMSTKYIFNLVDYAGNSTDAYSFTIRVELPQIEVYTLDGNNVRTTKVNTGDTIKENVQLICYSENIAVSCDTYDVKLYRDVGGGSYELVTSRDPTYVFEDYESTYRYVVSIKNRLTGYVYTNLYEEFSFTIDKVPPTITISGSNDNLWGIYKGEVRVIIDQNGKGTIYGNCVSTGVDELGDKIYECNEEPLVEEFEANYTLSETGVYKIIAVDEIGNVTTGSKIKYVTIDNDSPNIGVVAKGTHLDYALPEKGYTNAKSVVITSLDNNDNSYFKYRIKDSSGVYSEWIIQETSSLEISEEGYYEVKPIDLVGNEGLERHFIIYRQSPEFTVNGSNQLSYEIYKQDIYIDWTEPTNDLRAPIVKVTVNGKYYERRSVISETGEYVFYFLDLAGNSITHKITINKSDKICLNNVGLVPNKQYVFNVGNITLSASEDYQFKKNDVIILATPTHYYGGSACEPNTLSYKAIDKTAYLLIDENLANHINTHTNVSITLTDELTQKVNELGGFVYAFVVDKSVAVDDLGFKIGENFFTEDPLGWSLLFFGGIGLIYLGLKLFVFKKKVKVLK